MTVVDRIWGWLYGTKYTRMGQAKQNLWNIGFKKFEGTWSI